MASSKDPAPNEGPSDDAVVIDREALKRQSQAAFAELKERIGAEPPNYAEAIEQWEALVGSLEPVEAASAREEIATLRDRHAKAATKAFEELQAKAEKLEQDRRFQEALALLRAWPAESRSPAIDRQMRDLKRRLDLGAAAEREARPLLDKAKALAEAGSYRRAAGVLEGFDVDHYRETPWAQAIRDELAGYEVAESQKEQQLSLERIAERERQRIAAEKAALEKKIRDGDAWLARASYDPWFGDDLFTFKFPEPNPPNAWSMSKDRVLTGKSGAALQPGVGALTGTGESDWKDYVFEVEYKVVRGGFKLGVRYSKNRGAFVMLEPEVQKGGDWRKITISVRGRGPEAFQEILSGGSKRAVKFDAHDSSEGPICFVLEPQSEVQFRNLGVKVLPKELILD